MTYLANHSNQPTHYTVMFSDCMALYEKPIVFVFDESNAQLSFISEGDISLWFDRCGHNAGYESYIVTAPCPFVVSQEITPVSLIPEHKRYTYRIRPVNPILKTKLDESIPF